MGNNIRVKISGLGTYVPPRVLTNHDLEKMVETNNEWIITRTGIRERHIADKGVASSDLAVEAARKALCQAGVMPDQVEAIVVATVTPDMMFPATACLVQDKLGAPRAWGFDLSAGCCGFEYALHVGAQLVATGAHKKVLVIGSDVMSSIVDYTDRSICVLFGDGAGAMVLEPADGDGLGIIDFVHRVDGSGGQYLNMPGGGSLNPPSYETIDKKMHYIYQDGQQVFKFAVRTMADVCDSILERNGLTGDDIDLFISHQANLRIINATADRMKLPKEKVIVNIDRYGNTTAATIPLAFESARQEGKLKKGDLVLIAAVGAGYTAGASLVRWAY